MADILIMAAASGSAEVAHNLDHAAEAQGMPPAGAGSEAIATTEAPGAPVHHEDPTVLGLNSTVWVSLAMLVFLAILVAKKVPGLIVGGLDKQIADIRKQLADAKALRAEAEALRDEYARKIADAEKSAAEMAAQASHEAQVIVDQARADADELVRRRAKMAEDKIAAAERAALQEVRARTAAVAAQAAATLIAQRHGPDADRALVDRTIAGLGRLN